MAKRAAGFLIFRRLCERIEYLMLHAPSKQYQWTPPKGHVDPGEDDFTTALRETSEESGYTESDLKVYRNQSCTLEYKHDKGHDKVVVYWLAELRNPSQQARLSEEHQDMRWLECEDAIKIAGNDDFAKMIRAFDVRIKQSELGEP
uniref:Bis(5'-nucleosyl)-tetraphosphatase [asymmetrical] n=1 Tax=Anopheles braziliensis TaxID=58242 RepID=A0A2M3ZB81_9DIPT